MQWKQKKRFTNQCQMALNDLIYSTFRLIEHMGGLKGFTDTTLKQAREMVVWGAFLYSIKQVPRPHGHSFPLVINNDLVEAFLKSKISLHGSYTTGSMFSTFVH